MMDNTNSLTKLKQYKKTLGRHTRQTKKILNRALAILDL